MCLKQQEPYQCHFVPKIVVLSYFDRYPELCRQIFWTNHKRWLLNHNFRKRTVDQMRAATKEYTKAPEVKWFEQLVQAELNFLPSTMAAGHIHSRFGRIYRKHFNLDHTRHNDGTITFQEPMTYTLRFTASGKKVLDSLHKTNTTTV